MSAGYTANVQPFAHLIHVLISRAIDISHCECFIIYMNFR